MGARALRNFLWLGEIAIRVVGDGTGTRTRTDRGTYVLTCADRVPPYGGVVGGDPTLFPDGVRDRLRGGCGGAAHDHRTHTMPRPCLPFEGVRTDDSCVPLWRASLGISAHPRQCLHPVILRVPVCLSSASGAESTVDQYLPWLDTRKTHAW